MTDHDRPPDLAWIWHTSYAFSQSSAHSRLGKEIAYLRQHLTSGDHEVAMLDELDRLADLATERVHRYLWFVGD